MSNMYILICMAFYRVTHVEMWFWDQTDWHGLCNDVQSALYMYLAPMTHWGRDKMAAVSQTMFSNTFSLMKIYEFRLKFHWSLFLRFQLTIFQHWFRYWLGAVQATSHYLKQWWLVYWRIYASLALNEITWGVVSILKCPLIGIGFPL